MKQSSHLKQLAELLIALLLPLSATFFVAQSNYDPQPSAEGQLSPYTGAPYALYPGEWRRYPLYPGDNPPLYPGDEKWDGRYLYGLTTDIYAMTVDGNNLYVSLYDLPTSGDNIYTKLLRFNGSVWEHIWLNINATPQAVAVKGEDIYVGASDLTQANGNPVHYAVHQNGWQLDDMGGGLDGLSVSIKQMVIYGNSVCVGGTFTKAGNLPASSVACWDGVQWDTLDGGVNGSVNALAVSGSNLYVGGSFTQAGSQPVKNIAYWDGSAWQTLGYGVPGKVTALAFWKEALYAGNDSITPLLYWTGEPGLDWRSVSTSSNMRNKILNMTAGPDGLYVAGSYFSENIPNVWQPLNFIGRWDGEKWNILGSGIEGANPYYYYAVSSVQSLGSRVYAGGRFQHAGNNVAAGFAAWNTAPELENYQGYNHIINPMAPGSKAYLIGEYFNGGEGPVRLFVNGVDLQKSFYADKDGKIFFHLWFPSTITEGEYTVTLTGTSGSASTKVVISKNASIFETGWLGRIIILPDPLDGKIFNIDIPLITR